MPLIPIELEQAWQTRANRARRAHRRAQEQMTEARANLIADWAEFAPAVSPEITLPFVNAGITPRSQIGQMVATKVAARGGRRGSFVTRAADPVRAQAELRRLIADQEEATELAATLELFADKPQDEWGGVDLTDRQRDLLDRYIHRMETGGLDPVAVTGDGFMGTDIKITANPPKLVDLSEMRKAFPDLTPEPGGVRGFFHDVGDVVTTGSRAATGAFDDLYDQTLQGPVREAEARIINAAAWATPGGESGVRPTQVRSTGDLIGQDFEVPTLNLDRARNWFAPGRGPLITSTPFRPGIDKPVERSSLYQWLVKGEDAGSGWFLDFDSPAYQAAAQARRNQLQLQYPDGAWHASTAGRFAGLAVNEPGSDAFDVASGLVDATVAIKADVSALALAGAGAIGQARRTIRGLAHTADDVAHADDLIDLIRAEDGIGSALDATTNVNGIQSLLEPYGWKGDVRIPPDLTAAIAANTADGSTLELAQAYSKMYADAGAFVGKRRAFDPWTADQWIRDHPETLAALDGATSWTRINTMTGGRLPGTVVGQLARTNEAGSTARILAPHLGLDITEAPRIRPFDRVRRITDSARWKDQMPNGGFWPDDIDQSTEQARRLLQTAKVPLDRQDAVLTRLSAVHPRQPDMFYAAFTDNSPDSVFRAVVDTVGSHRTAFDRRFVNDAVALAPARWKRAQKDLANAEAEFARLANPTAEQTRRLDNLRRATYAMGDNPDDATDLARLSAEAELTATKTEAGRRIMRYYGNRPVDESTYYAVSALEASQGIGTPLIAGQIFDLSHGPSLPTELLSNPIPVPDVRELRRATSAIADLWTLPGVRGAVGALEWLAEGWTGTMKVLALARLAYPLRVIGEEQIRMMTTGYSNVWSDPFQAIAAAFTKDPAAYRSALGTPFEEFAKAKNRYQRAYGDALSKRGESRVGLDFARRYTTTERRVIASDHADYARGWADQAFDIRDDPLGRAIARGLADGNLDAVKEATWAGDLIEERRILANAGLFGGRSRVFWTDRDAWDAFIDAQAVRVGHLAAGDDDLLRMMGKVDGHTDEAAHAFARERTANLATGGIGPQRVVATVARRGADRWTLQRLTQAMFAVLSSAPTNKLSRSPMFREGYWNKIRDLAPHMDDGARLRAAGNARAAGYTDIADAIERSIADVAHRTISLKEADQVARIGATRDVHRLLMDFADRNQFFDIFRVVFPFGDAWKEVMGTWARLGRQRPQVYRRLGQSIGAARQSGFMVTNPDDGKDYFAIPFSSRISQAIAGLPYQYTAAAGGLNLVASGLPGLGPVGMIAADRLIPNNDDWAWVRDQIMPFGNLDYEAGMVESQFPGWAKALTRWANASRTDRSLETAVKQAYIYRASTGAYNLSDPTDKAKLEADAREDARNLLLVDALQKLWSPSAPRAVPTVRDRDENLFAQAAMARFAQGLRDEFPETWQIELLDRYGGGVRYMLEPKNERVIPGVPITDRAVWWRADHSRFADAYRTVYGLWAPQGGEQSNSAYERAIERGEIKPSSTADWVRLTDHNLASVLYHDLVKAAGPHPNDAQRQMLRDEKAHLKEILPGYDPGRRPDKPTMAGRIVEVARAANDDEFLDSPQSVSIRDYLAKRDEAVAAWEGLGYSPTSFGSAEKAAPLRDWLRAWGWKIVTEQPEFAPAWYDLFSWELEEEGAE